MKKHLKTAFLSAFLIFGLSAAAEDTPCRDGIEGAPHANGGGFVAATAQVAKTAFVAKTAAVCGNAHVAGDARVAGKALVGGKAQVYGDAQVYDNAQVYGNARVDGLALVAGDALVAGGGYALMRLLRADLLPAMRVFGNGWRQGAEKDG